MIMIFKYLYKNPLGTNVNLIRYACVENEDCDISSYEVEKNNINISLTSL